LLEIWIHFFVSKSDELSRSAFELKLQLHAQPSVLSTKSSAWTHNSKSIKLERSSDSKVDALGPTSFDAWLQTRPHLLQSFLSRFELLPTPQQERAQIRFALSEVASSGLRLGDKWFVLSQSWWNQWRQFVRFDNDELAPEGELFARPTAVDNAALQGDLFDAELKPDLVEGKDFVLLPETAWAKLIGLFSFAIDYSHFILIPVILVLQRGTVVGPFSRAKSPSSARQCASNCTRSCFNANGIDRHWNCLDQNKLLPWLLTAPTLTPVR
jgi:hypothetical protein